MKQLLTFPTVTSGGREGLPTKKSPNLPHPPVFSGAANEPHRTAAALAARQPASTRKAAAALPQQQRHPVDAAPAFCLGGFRWLRTL